MKKFMNKALEWAGNHDGEIINLSYAAVSIFTIIYLACASVSVLKKGISYR